jgi:DNA-binding MarR family transcriptional regulator
VPSPRRSAEGLRPGPLLNLFSASQLAASLVREEFEAIGLPPYWVGVLHLIWLNEPVTPSALEALSGVRPTTLRDVIDGLVERGQVERRPNPDDRRSTLLSVTDEGERVAIDAMKATSNAYKRLQAHLPWPVLRIDSELEDLIRALQAALGLPLSRR